MGRAIDLFVTYRFLRLLTTPFEDTDAFKLGIIDEKGNRIRKPKSTTSLFKNGVLSSTVPPYIIDLFVRTKLLLCKPFNRLILF